ncbi:uncharacterized protein LOC113470673 [Diaphorina citri]|uniref:Uncharacterized protein LOC113470673 n=1 Tax=Diaphorina citri TaxID=121845 RepID=A0A3Q0JEI8_DIACI|nr:uncharacterized protein LOC113470673 [Diaphorina citri]
MKATESLAPDDSTSTLFLIQKLKSESYDPILIFKPVGPEVIAGPDSTKELSDEIFILGIQTKDQMKLMESCAQDILIIDATHDMTQYGLQLLNVMGVDEFNKGYPLAHCISNKMDANTLKHFFEAIKLKIPNLNVNCIITDDDPALINAANAGFAADVRHLLCLWHFKRSIQKNLHAKVRNTELEKEMFNFVCTIIDCETEDTFNKLLDAFLKMYENCTEAQSFTEYFHTYCLSKTEKWAMFARRFPHKNVDTTMYVESFHNILKSIYLKRRPNKRVDTLLNLLLQVEEDNYSRRNLSLVTNNREAVINSISQHHVKSVSILDNNVEEVIGNSLWKVQSASSQTQEENNSSCYDVQRCASICPLPEWCFYKCNSPLCVGLCSHLYVCTCPTNSPLCKHIHKVHSQCIKKCGTIAPVSTSPEKAQSYSLPYPIYDDNNNCAKNNDASEKNGSLLIPEMCMSHVNGLLSQLLAECSSVGTNQPSVTPTSLKPTMKRGSREKLACQVLPSKKKRKMKKTSYPTKAEKKQIQQRALDNSEQNSDREYEDLIIEEDVV